MCFSNLFKPKKWEIPSPSDIVPKDSISIIDTNVVIDLTKLNIPFTKSPKIWIPDIPDTGSMDPNFDSEHNNILIQGADEPNQKILVDWLAEQTEKEFHNIAVYNNNHLYAIHRVIGVAYDKEGRYFTFKGDNNPTNDPYPVRDFHIQWVSIGTIF